MNKRFLFYTICLLFVFSLIMSGCGGNNEGDGVGTTVYDNGVVPSDDNNDVIDNQNDDNNDFTPMAASDNILRIRTDADIGSLDPAFIVRWVDDTVSRAVMEGLIRYIPDTDETEYLLAEWIEISDDGLEIHFKLREGIQWHGGFGELTTEDVKFSFERFRDEELASTYASDWASLDRVEIIDDHEGIIILSEPQATLWTTTLPLTSGLIISKAFYEEVGHDAFQTTIIGTGPYILSEWRPDERLILTRNPDYWGELPDWEEIHLIPIADDTSAEIAFLAGELDFAEITLAASDQFENHPNYRLMTLATNTYNWIGMNIENPKLEDINVRLAIRYGIDVPSILEAVYAGKADQARAIIPPRILGHWEDAPLYERDVERALGYMEQAGLTSLDLELAILNTVDYTTWAAIIQQNLAEIGINIQINLMDSAAFWDIGMGDSALDVELFAIHFNAMSDPAWFTMWFTSDQVSDGENDGWNWMRWVSPEFDELHARGLTSLDPVERAAIYIEMQELWDEAVHTVWVTHLPRAYVFMPYVVPVMDSNGRIPMVRDFGRLE